MTNDKLAREIHRVSGIFLSRRPDESHVLILKLLNEAAGWLGVIELVNVPSHLDRRHLDRRSLFIELAETVWDERSKMLNELPKES